MNYKRTQRLLTYLLAGAFVLLGPATGRIAAQVVKGSISGTVIDGTGAVVPGADVKATGQERGDIYSSVTDQTGLFHIALVGIGTYTLEISKPGFRTLASKSVVVQAAQDTALGTLTLDLGKTTTTVEVTGASPILETTQAQVTNSVSSTAIQSFPGLSLNQGLDQLALQAPGVTSSRDANFSNTNGTSVAVNGLRGRSNDQQIDGQNNNDNSVTGPQIFVSNPDFVQEYQIVTNNFGPEYGRNAGSVVNVITKSGTNNWHGTGSITDDNWRFDSLSNTQKAFEGLTQVPTYNNEFSGFSLGGPIKKDKLFVFGGFDDQIVPGTAVDATGSLTPTPAGLTALQSCFPSSPSVAALVNYGPYGIKGGNPVLSGTPSSVNLTGSNGLPCAVEVAGVQRTLSTAYKEYDYTARLDWNGIKDHIYGRWLYQKTTNDDVTGSGATGYPVSVPGFGEDWGMSWARTISPSMVNELRLSYGRSTAEFGGNNIGNTVPDQTNIANGLATVSIASPFTGFGPSSSYPQGRIVNTYQFQDNWSYFHGAHQLKAGMNLTYQRSPNVFLPYYNGGFSFTNLQNFAADVPSSVNVTLGTPNLDFREHDSFFYFGDDYKVRPNLTLNLGVTYTYFGQPANLFNNLDTKNETGSTPFFDPSLPLTLRVFPSLPAPKNQLGPSAGFAYSPQWGGWLTGNGKTVIRGGYRLSFDPPFYNIYLNIASSSPQVLSQTLTGSTAAGVPMLAQPFGPANRNELGPFLTLGVADPRSFNQTMVTPDFHADHVQQWTLGIQREIARETVVEARYVGNHGGSLLQSINGNPYIADTAAMFPGVLPSGVTPCSAADAVVSKAVGRVNCDEGVVRLRTNTGVSDYQALQTELRMTNFKNQLTMRTAYTWSKTTDNVTDIYGSGTGGAFYGYSQDPLNYVNGEHGLSALDFPQSWTMTLSEAIPAYRNQHGVLGHVLGGWTVAGTYVLQSGQPYTPYQWYLNTFSGPNQFFDTGFDNAFNLGSYETARPFAGSRSAPVSAVGIYAGDACNFFGTGCDLAASQLLSLNALNANGAAVNVNPNQVRFIANGQTADSIYGTPFGSAGRNVLRDFNTNTGNFSLAKEIRVNERVKLMWRMDMLNVFNHPNFASVDPLLEDAGLTQLGTGFGLPSLFDGGHRNINFQLKIYF